MSEDAPLQDLSEQLREVSNRDPIDGGPGEDAGDASVDLDDVDWATLDPGEPAFPAEDAEQGPIFARSETWERYERAMAEIREVLEDRGVEDPAGREVDDAVLQLAARNPEAVAELILAARTDRE